MGTVQLAPPARRPTTRWRRAWPALAWVAAVSNLTFLLRPFVGSGLAPLTTEISALAVDGQPLAWVFRTGDVVFGVTTVLLGTGVLARPAPWRGGSARAPSHRGASDRDASRWDAARWLAAGMVLSGAGNAVAAAVPETSTGDLDGAALLGSPADTTHGLASLLAGVGLVVGVAACAWGLHRSARNARDAPDARRATVVLAAGLAVALVVLSVAEALGALLGAVPASGAVQRVQVLASSVWTVLVGVVVAGADHRGS